MARVDQCVAFSGWPSRVSDHSLDLGILDLARGAGAGQVDKAVKAMRQEAGAPRRDAHVADAKGAGDGAVGRARLSAGQHDAGALGQRLTDIATAHKPFQAGAFSPAQVKVGWFGATGHRQPPCRQSCLYGSRPTNRNRTSNSYH